MKLIASLKGAGREPDKAVFKWHYKAKGKRLWQVVIWIEGENGRDTDEIQPKNVCTMSELLPVILANLADILADRVDITSFGFEVRG